MRLLGKLLAALAVFAASIAANPVSAPANGGPRVLDLDDFCPDKDCVELDLSHMGFSGSIPAELGELSRLTRLILRGNRFTGSIPAELGKLSNLTRLDLSDNPWLTGSIPAELGKLSNLEWLTLSGNHGLTGSIPAELGKLSNLTRLNLSDNPGLTGSIPAELGELSNLERLTLRDNRLTGSIPAELGKLSNLLSLDLRGNRLTGSIPAELGKLSNLLGLNPHIGEIGLDLSDNQLTGSIPAELGELSRLRRLDLSFNGLTGSIPAELGELSRLVRLDLSFNRLTGSIPAELGELPSEAGPAPTFELRGLNLNCNDFTGTDSRCFIDEDGSVHEANIERIARWGITLGCEPRRFCPSRTVNRAQMAVFLYRAAEHLYGARPPRSDVRLPFLRDVDHGAWYRAEVSWAMANRVIWPRYTQDADGHLNANFEPDGAVTRADMAEMLVAAFAHLSAPDRAEGVFTDTAGLSDGAVRAVEGIAAAEVTTGCATGPRRYCPDRTVTRAQMASFLARAVQSVP